MVVQICYFHTQQYGKLKTKYVIYEREKNHESLETTCWCIPYCVHRKLITEKTTIFVRVNIAVSTKLSRLLRGHSIKN